MRERFLSIFLISEIFVRICIILVIDHMLTLGIDVMSLLGVIQHLIIPIFAQIF